MPSSDAERLRAAERKIEALLRRIAAIERFVRALEARLLDAGRARGLR